MAGTNEANAVTDGGRFPVYVLLDTSGSMAGNVDQLKNGLRETVAQLSNDTQVSEITAISVVEFNSDVRTFIPLSRLWDTTFNGDLDIKAGGVTLTGKALKTVNELAKKDLHLASVEGYSGDYKPLLVIMTDGYCTDENGNTGESAKRMLEEGVREIKSYPWGGILACGMGKFNRDELNLITEHVVEINDIKNFFKLLKATITSSSKTAYNSSMIQGNDAIYTQPLQASIRQMQTNANGNSSMPSNNDFV